MEFLTPNLFNTTTQATVNSNTTTVANLLNRDTFIQYYSSGFNNDATTVSLTITFDTTTNVSRIVLMQHNLKKFNIYYNGATANSFSLSGGATTTSQWTANSETSQYLTIAATVAVSSITIDMYSTQVANSEKAMGWLAYADTQLVFDRIPSASNFDPVLASKQIRHELSDGGVRIHHVRNKWKTKIKFNHISETFRNNLFAIWNAHSEFIFCPWGTSTGWDSQIAEVVWAGDFQFYQYSDNNPNAGFDGVIELMETPN